MLKQLIFFFFPPPPKKISNAVWGYGYIAQRNIRATLLSVHKLGVETGWNPIIVL